MGNEGEGVEENGGWTANSTVDPPLQRVGDSTEIVEETQLDHQRRGPNLALEIPKRTFEDATEDFVRINMSLTPSPTPRRVNFSPLPSPKISKFDESPGPSTSKNKLVFRSLLPKLSFKYRNTTSDIQKAAVLALGGPSAETRGKPRFQRTFSLPKLFTPRTKKTSSFPVTPTVHSNPESMHGQREANDTLPTKGEARPPIHRSRSVPVLNKDGRSMTRMDSFGGVFRVIPTTPRVANKTTTTASNPSPENDGNNDGGEDIPEEEAVCRICLIEVGEGGDTFKMECSCKGELALAHQECAIKWFSIKGNKICDVCKQEVQNLPVTLLRVQNVQTHNLRGIRGQQAESVRYRVWQDVPILVIVSMLAYFCFLEQLLVSKMKSSAIAISLPFSCILGLLASMTSTTMVRKKYVWFYATLQFGLVVLSAHLFYTFLHIQAVISVLLSTFVGFGMTMCGTSILYEVFKWLRSRHGQSNEQPVPSEVTQQDQPPITANQT
ncbi:hypothetical protein SLEP1_g23401 [Rubroshorea leprosula]|uniref:RING-CH-type domain-containing protein n=2 Tax=Rubroshorea leprosula TaxID=152421 RepID=A0AAV5JFB1_9ROSI|nr:hypothetical protein SLEP1_g23401 [Rubroshorea leprosula]